MATAKLKTYGPAAIKVRRLYYPLPTSLKRAAGLLRHKRKALIQHLETVRREWSRT